MTKILLDHETIAGLIAVAKSIESVASQSEAALPLDLCLLSADQFRQAARFLIRLADSLDPRGSSIVLVEVPQTASNAGITGLLATVQAQAAEIAQFRLNAPLVVPDNGEKSNIIVRGGDLAMASGDDHVAKPDA
jgi:hypothetical protein